MSGSFNGLEEIIKKRLNTQGIGFGAEIKCKDERIEYLKQVKAEDMIEFGFESEFVGRLPVVTVFEHLEVEDLYNILRNPKSPIVIGKKRDFKSYGIDLQFEDEALHKIAKNAHKERTGARGLNSAVERVLLKFEHILPSTNICYLVVTPAMVDNPERELRELLEHPDTPEREARFKRLLADEEKNLEQSILKRETELQDRYGLFFSDRRIKLITTRTVEERMDLDAVIEEILALHNEVLEFAEMFSCRNDIKISFTEEAIDRLVEKAWREGIDSGAFLQKSFQNYEHGLKLIKEKTGKRKYTIPPEGVENPENYMNELIRDTYKN